MPSYSVTRSGKNGHFELYQGRLRWRAEDTYERAKPEAGTVVILTEYRDKERRVLRRSDEVVTASCSRCRRPICGDEAPAVDAFTNLPVCDTCTNGERHARRAS